MPLPFRPNCLPHALGPLPHGAEAAPWELVLPVLAQFPPLPSLAAAGEGLAALSLAGFPGAEWEAGFLWDAKALHAGLHALDVAYLRGAVHSRALALLAVNALRERPRLVGKTQAVSVVLWGPFSLALALTNAAWETALADAAATEALTKHLHLRLEWFATVLRPQCRNLVQWLYEPYLPLLGSPFVPWTWAMAGAAWAGTWSSNAGTQALWVGAGTALPPVLACAAVELVGVPLPEVEQAVQWAGALRDFFARKGSIAWGLVPTTSEGLRTATAGRLAAQFGGVVQALRAAGLPTETLTANALVMPDDTLAHLSPREAEHVLQLTNELAALLRQTYIE